LRAVRRAYLAIIVLVVAALLAASALLARAFSAEGAERSAITALVQAQARGDIDGMLARIHGCAASAACRQRVAANAAVLRRPGSVSILQLLPSAGFSLAGTLGTARVAWRAAGSLPVVQCARVRRTGDVISGLQVQVLAISARIGTSADCPARF